MERKFESDLARRVTGVETSRRSRKTGLVFAAFAVCAMLGTTALYAVAVTEEAGPPLTKIVIWTAESSEYYPPGGTEFAVRHMSLKVQGDHDNADEDSPIQDSMFVYVLEVNTRSAGASILEDTQLGVLTLPVTAGVLDVTYKATVSYMVPAEV
ncbi:MAG: hypothetical protein MUO94_06450, partial [Thermoplasmata archaeon]|nr:hypothetical protein [Thermoplasmata archaeon]